MEPFSKPNLPLCMLLIGACFGVSFCSSTLMEESNGGGSSYVQDACSVTRYRDVCIRSLSSFSHSAKNDPSKWARASVSVTIREAKRVARYAAKLNGQNENNASSRAAAAVSDCVELFQDALDILHSSLYALRNFTFSSSDDIMTWLSAALTDEDTCLDGFDTGGGGGGGDVQDHRKKAGKGIRVLRDRVENASYMTSNALALVNQLVRTAPPN